MKKIIFLILNVIAFSAMAQEVEMADKLREDGKIYVVLGVISIVLAGIFIYLILQDRRINKLMRERKHLDNTGF